MHRAHAARLLTTPSCQPSPPQELTSRDRSQATNLAASLAAAAPEWAAELQAMLASGSKVGLAGWEGGCRRKGALPGCHLGH